MSARLAHVSWACEDPHAPCHDDTCSAVICLGEEPAALDADGYPWCSEHREAA